MCKYCADSLLCLIVVAFDSNLSHLFNKMVLPHCDNSLWPVRISEKSADKKARLGLWIDI